MEAHEALQTLLLRDGSMMQFLHARAFRQAWMLAVAVWLGLALASVGECQTTSGARPSRPQGTRPQTTQGNKGQKQPVRPSRGTKQPIVRQADRSAVNPAAAPDQRATQSMPSEPRVPEWMPLTQEHQNYINQVLASWEARSSKIKRYQCEFTRWRYILGFDETGEIILDKRGKEAAAEIVKGHIDFESPDKALFQVIQGWRYVPKDQDYRDATLEEIGEHWLCDGKSFFEFNDREKILRKFPLPPEAQGEAIARGPLPFLFRAKANDISNRFWLRIVTPKDETEAYHLEATPKAWDDAREFSRVVIILDEKEFLPKALAIFPPGEDPSSPRRELFVFEKRKVNPILDAIKKQIWMDKFSEPKPPKGWKLVVEEPSAPLDEGIAPAEAEEPARQAKSAKKLSESIR
jgi:TIGR03009 family protein